MPRPTEKRNSDELEEEFVKELTRLNKLERCYPESRDDFTILQYKRFIEQAEKTDKALKKLIKRLSVEMAFKIELSEVEIIEKPKTRITL